MGLLLDVTDTKESRFVDPVNFTDDCDAAVPGLVGGFIPNGACVLSGGGRIGAGFFGEVDDAIFAAGGSGNGLFGGSVVGDPGLDGMLVGDNLYDISSSFAGGDGGIVNLQPFPFWSLFVIPLGLSLVSLLGSSSPSSLYRRQCPHRIVCWTATKDDS